MDTDTTLSSIAILDRLRLYCRPLLLVKSDLSFQQQTVSGTRGLIGATAACHADLASDAEAEKSKLSPEMEGEIARVPRMKPKDAAVDATVARQLVRATPDHAPHSTIK